MRKLFRVFLLAAVLVTALCVSALAADEPEVAGLYGFRSADDAVSIVPRTAAETASEIKVSDKGGKYSAFYEDAVRFDVTYTNANLAAGEQCLLLVCSGSGAPDEGNIVYINQGAANAGSVRFENAYPSSLGRGDYRIYIVSTHSAYDLDKPTATFSCHVPFKPGDVNEDGKVTTLDAAIILRHAAQVKKLEETKELLAADVTNDGKVDVNDALKVMRFVVGKASLNND